MPRAWRFIWAAALALASSCAAAVALTDTEMSWLQAALPVLSYAREQGLPLDIVVQPQPTPGATPFGMAYVGGRCKLVLSMRDNPEAQATLDRIDPALRGPVVEAITAHELAHCWRHLQQTWGSLPPGLEEISAFDRLSTEQAGLLKERWRTRHEEGYADLVGLRWTLLHHADCAAEVHAWDTRLRAEQPIQTGPHDFRAVWRPLGGRPAAPVLNRGRSRFGLATRTPPVPQINARRPPAARARRRRGR